MQHARQKERELKSEEGCRLDNQSMDEQPIHLNANRIEYNVIMVTEQWISDGNRGQEDNL